MRDGNLRLGWCQLLASDRSLVAAKKKRLQSSGEDAALRGFKQQNRVALYRMFWCKPHLQSRN